jgi:hypothetical protein
MSSLFAPWAAVEQLGGSDRYGLLDVRVLRWWMGAWVIWWSVAAVACSLRARRVGIAVTVPFCALSAAVSLWTGLAIESAADAVPLRMLPDAVKQYASSASSAPGVWLAVAGWVLASVGLLMLWGSTVSTRTSSGGEDRPTPVAVERPISAASDDDIWND